jgi:hypothetical protein
LIHWTGDTGIGEALIVGAGALGAGIGGGEPSIAFHVYTISSQPQEATKPSTKHDASSPTANSV